MTGRRVLPVITLVVGVVIAIILWVVLVDTALKLGRGQHAAAVALVPAGIVLVELIVVATAFLNLYRHPARGLTICNALVWASNLVSFGLFTLFPVL